MCIKSALYLHKKSANWASNIVFFLYTLVLMLPTKFVPNGTFRSRSSGIYCTKKKAHLSQIEPKSTFSAPQKKK